MTTRHLALVLILLGLLQPLSGALAPVFDIGTQIGAATRETDAPEQPLPAFFAIWGVIFLAYAGFGAALALKPQDAARPVAMAMIAAGAFNILWMLSAQLIDSQPLNALLLAPIIAAAWLAARRLATLREPITLPVRRTADAATGLLAGWISVATAITVPLTIRTFSGLGPTDHVWPMLWTSLGLAALAAWLFNRFISPSLWFHAALVWGLAGIVLNNWLQTGMHGLAAVAGVVTATILLVRVTRAQKRIKPMA